MKRTCLRFFAVVFAAAVLCLGSPLASAQEAGYDLLQTPGGASIELKAVPGLSPTIIPLQGVPICSCAGSTDTIMYRPQAVPKIVPPGGAKIPLIVFALFLRNAVPVKLNNQPVDVYITVNNSGGDLSQTDVPQPDVLRPPLPSTSSLLVHSNADHTSGTFDSQIQVTPDVLVVPQGTDVRTAKSYLYNGQGPTVTLRATGSAWISTPPAGYPLPCFPANGFYPGGPVNETDRTNASHKHPAVPGGSVSPGPRCVSFNPATTKFELVGTNWVVVDGSVELFNLGPGQSHAQRMVTIIKNYSMSQSCTVGDSLWPSGPAFRYMLLADNTPPSGALSGEVCHSFNPAAVRVSPLAAISWKVSDDDGRVMFAFTNKPEADEALGLIKGYGFDHLCFLGTPDQASNFFGGLFTYFRK